MATINYAAREINVKIVYYGPALSGKTTNLQIIHKKVPQESKSDMVSLATESDRTLFFDFLPIDLGKIKGFTTKIQLYTVPGQVYYNATRKLVLRGVDGIVFVADSSVSKLAENLESLDNMEENLSEYGYSLKTIPIVLQYNKRDCEDPMSVAELEGKLNRYGSKCVPAIARSGEGVFDTLKVISREVIGILNKKYEGATASSSDSAQYTPPPVMRPTTQTPIQQSPVSNYESEIDIPEYSPHTQKIPETKPKADDFSDFIDIPQTTPQKSDASYNRQDVMDDIGIDLGTPPPAKETPSYESDFGLALDDEIAPPPPKPAASPAPAAAAYNDLDFAFDDIATNPVAQAAPKPAPSPAPAVSAYDEISLDDSFSGGYQEKEKPAPSPAPIASAYDDISLDDSLSVGYQEKEIQPKETTNAYDDGIQLDDMFDSSIEAAPKPAPAQQPHTSPTTVIPSVNRVIETPPSPPPPVQPVQTPPPPAAPVSNSILEDVLDDSYNTPPPKPTFQAQQTQQTTNAADPIRAAFQNKRTDAWVPPEKMLFTSVATNSQKTEHIIATKKKPVNPKYKKSLLDNLFKKQQPE